MTYGGLQLEPRWIAAHTERPPDRDAVQLAQMAQRAVPNVMRTIPDPELQAIRIEPGETESYAFQFRSASAPARMAQWSIRIMNGQEVSNFSGAGHITVTASMFSDFEKSNRGGTPESPGVRQ